MLNDSLPLGVLEDEPLHTHCTLELGGRARYFASCTSEHSLVSVLRWAKEQGIPWCILAGGSNTIVPDEGVAGLVVQPALWGFDVVRGIDGFVEVTVGAGESWDRVVARCVEQQWAGIESLSGIPGSSGATPIQNVGAYGQELSDVFVRARVLDPNDFTVREVDHASCAFAYRDSAFKHEESALFGTIVLSVTIRLKENGVPALRYAELEKAIAAKSATPSLSLVRATVLSLRRSKSMVLDPTDENHRSVGSFFMNPVLATDEAEKVISRAITQGIVSERSAVPTYPAGPSKVKLAAGWLIERSGFRKGERRGSVGLSSKHALALVHHGGGSTKALMEFSEEISRKVFDCFGVRLEREPVVLRAR